MLATKTLALILSRYRSDNSYQTVDQIHLTLCCDKRSLTVTIGSTAKWLFLSDSHKKVAIRPRVCRTALIRCALESPLVHSKPGQILFTDTLRPTADLVTFEKSGLPQNLESWQSALRWKLHIWCDAQKQVAINLQLCPTMLIRRALESRTLPNPMGVKPFFFRHFGTNLTTFEMAGHPYVLNILINSTFWQCPESGTIIHFKCDEVGPKVSENEVWPTIGCARVRAFQRTSN